MDRIDVLDHGFVRLVDFMGNDVSVVRAARVSYDAAWRAGEDQGSDTRLINYLWKNKHTTPFEAITFTFEVKAPIFVLRQWMRHRTWSFNELSGRYRELPEEFYVPKPEHLGVQSKNNKQARDLTGDPNAPASAIIAAACADAFVAYRKLLECGTPRELARSVLPVATCSHMFATVDLLNLLKFLSLRCDAHAQDEIRFYADQCASLRGRLHQSASRRGNGLMGDRIPTESRIFADRYLRETRRLEKVHANRLSPGTANRSDALRSLSQRLSKIGSPIKRVAVLRGIVDYLNGLGATSEQIRHISFHYGQNSRTAVFSFATLPADEVKSRDALARGWLAASAAIAWLRDRPSDPGPLLATIPPLVWRGDDFTSKVAVKG